MALYTLADLISEVQDIRTSVPQAKIVRSLNKVLERIHFENSLPQYATFVTKPSVTTGTVSVTQDSTTATFSSAILATTDPIDLVKIEGDSAWFKLTPTSTTEGTLSSAWAVDTDATATFTLVRPTISFPFAVGQILRIWREGDRELEYATDPGQEYGAWLAETVGTPRRWVPYIHDSSAATPNDDLLRIMLSPAPEDRETWMYAYRTRPTLLTAGGATTQTIPLPDFWWPTVVAGTLAYVYEIREGLQAALPKHAEYEAVYRRTRGSRQPSAVIGPKTRGRRGLLAYSPNPTNA